jgi:hypothetical protein
MRILLVGNHWTDGPGGAETMLLLTAELLRRAGHEVVPADPGIVDPEDTAAPRPL